MSLPSRRVRVLQVIAPARTGGAETVVGQLCRGLRAEGHDVHVAAVLQPGDDRDHPFLDLLAHYGVPVTPVVVTGRAYHTERREVANCLRTLNADVLHTHGYRADVIDGGLASAAGIPHVTTLHGFVGLTRLGRFYEWLQLRRCRHADRVICVSESVAQRVLASCRSAKVEVLPNAVITDEFRLSRAEARNALGLHEEDRVLAWVGRLGYEKGPDVFVDAVSQSSASFIAVMIGDGPEFARTRARASALGLEGRIRFLGAIPRASRYFSAFDALALTSRTEGTPMVLLESMLAGVPVIATRVGGVPDLVAHAGLLCPAEDAKSIAEAFDLVMSRPAEVVPLISAARDRVNDHFSSAKWIAAHAQLYARISSYIRT